MVSMPKLGESGIPLAKPERRYERHLPLLHPRLRGREMEKTPQPPARGTTVLNDGARTLGRAEEPAKEFPEGWVYFHVEYRGR
jgi:hypothetical protein